MTGFAPPLPAELPLDGLEAFRLASFGIEYVPQYAPVIVDTDCADARLFLINPATIRFDTDGRVRPRTFSALREAIARHQLQKPQDWPSPPHSFTTGL